MIWLVDDDPDEMFLIQRTLHKLQPRCPVQTFETIDEALAALESATPAILVSDLNMPGTDGVEFLIQAEQQMRARNQTLPKMLLVTAAIPENIHLRTASMQNLTAILTKPDLPQDLARQLLALLSAP